MRETRREEEDVEEESSRNNPQDKPRHKRSGFKLKRDAGSRNSLLKNLVTSVIESDFIITTVPKAKAVRPLVEKMITLAKT